MSLYRTVLIRHWLPILTYCPVNRLPDLLYVTVEYDGDELHELYAVRKRIRKLISGREMYMEELAELLALHFDTASKVTVRLAFSRHVVIYTRK